MDLNASAPALHKVVTEFNLISKVYCNLKITDILIHSLILCYYIFYLQSCLIGYYSKEKKKLDKLVSIVEFKAILWYKDRQWYEGLWLFLLDDNMLYHGYDILYYRDGSGSVVHVVCLKCRGVHEQDT